jgi:hypothetical protein
MTYVGARRIAQLVPCARRMSNAACTVLPDPLVIVIRALVVLIRRRNNRVLSP